MPRKLLWLCARYRRQLKRMGVTPAPKQADLYDYAGILFKQLERAFKV